MMTLRGFFLASVSLGAFSLAVPANAQSDTPSSRGPAMDGPLAVVLDVSGSMGLAPQGREGGQTRIERAREILMDLEQDWQDDDRPISLVAFGHTDRRDCGDIEVLTGPDDPEAKGLDGLLASLEPTGRSPITNAVRVAAETANWRAGPANVVLITDSVDTCAADPCRLAEGIAGLNEDEDAAANLTVHVIDLGVAAEDVEHVSCLPRQTGGLYLDGYDDGVVDQLLTAMVRPDDQAQQQPAAIVEVTLNAIGNAGAPIAGTVDWSIVDAADGSSEPVPTNGSSVTVPLETGHYIVSATQGDTRGAAEISVAAGGNASFAISLQPISPQARLSAPTAVPAGSTINVVWDGPGDPPDRITLAYVNAPPENSLVEVPVGRGSPLQLTTPPFAGAYEVRYFGGDSRRVLARLPIVLTPAVEQVQLWAPRYGNAGGEITVGWDGPARQGDTVTIVQAGAPQGATGEAWVEAASNQSTTLRLPSQPGQYEVRYMAGQSGLTLASQPLTVTNVATSLSLPSGVITPGQSAQVSWQGTAKPGDVVYIVPQGQGIGSAVSRVQVDQSGGGQIALPSQPGEYELRYVDQDTGQTMSILPLLLGAAAGGLAVLAATSDDEPEAEATVETEASASATAEEQPAEEAAVTQEQPASESEATAEEPAVEEEPVAEPTTEQPAAEAEPVAEAEPAGEPAAEAEPVEEAPAAEQTPAQPEAAAEAEPVEEPAAEEQPAVEAEAEAQAETSAEAPAVQDEQIAEQPAAEEPAPAEAPAATVEAGADASAEVTAPEGETIVDDAADAAAEAGTAVGEAVEDTGEAAVDAGAAVGEAAVDAGTAVGEAVEDTADAAVDAGAAVGETVEDAADAAAEAAADVGSVVEEGVEAAVEAVVPVTVSAPATVTAGESFNVAVAGLAEGASGTLDLAPAGGAPIGTASFTGDATVAVTAPQDPGVYELRYTGNDGATATTTITVQ